MNKLTDRIERLENRAAGDWQIVYFEDGKYYDNDPAFGEATVIPDLDLSGNTIVIMEAESW